MYLLFILLFTCFFLRKSTELHVQHSVQSVFLHFIYFLFTFLNDNLFSFFYVFKRQICGKRCKAILVYFIILKNGHRVDVFVWNEIEQYNAVE